jgi:hypothetical protein
MYAETYRPNSLDDVIGHDEAKKSLRDYLRNPSFSGAIMLSGPPGIGKTTLALAAAKTMEFEPLEINASRSIRSFEDVQKIKDACKSAVSIQSFLRGERNRKTCVILDEVDGSDPHAQSKIIEWVRDKDRKVPIICTGNELPTIFKRNASYITLVRCFPPRSSDIEHLFPNVDVQTISRECQHDIRRMFHRIQYGVSDVIPKYSTPPTGLSVEKSFAMRQAMFDLPDVLPRHVYRVDTLGISQTLKANSKCKSGDTDAHTDESDKPLKKSRPGKSRKSQSHSEHQLGRN